MTPEAQRIAIAEACGWKMVGCCDVLGRPPKSNGRPHAIPDYLTDLNAMHEAEKVLTWEQRAVMHRELCRISRARPDFKQRPDIMETVWFIMSEATSAQRAEAFCRTMPSKQNPSLSIWEWHERNSK